MKPEIFNLQFKDKLKTYVIASGIVYGAEEEDLFFLFKLAWKNEEMLPVFSSGKNFIPLIHVKDLARYIVYTLLLPYIINLQSYI